MRDNSKGQLVHGEIRDGRLGFYCCPNGRKHVFLHLTETEGTSMDIGPCPGDESCPYAETHGRWGPCTTDQSNLESRRIELDAERRRREQETCLFRFGRKRNRRDYSVMHLKGNFWPEWCYELARDAEAADGLTGGWPDDWLKRKCEASERGHSWWYHDDDDRECRRDEPDRIADATRRHCTRCPVTQMKRPDGKWSSDRDDCPCCAEHPPEYSQYYCSTCDHAPSAADEVHWGLLPL